MSFLKMRNVLLALIVSTLLAGGAWATPVGDNYIGATDSLNRDVIGNHHEFDIAGANIQRVGSELLVQINTNFAGLADNMLYSNYTTSGNGIGYGDLFLAPKWTPSGSSPYEGDDHSNGTTWTHGFSLDNRWSDLGGDGALYKLDPLEKANEILLSETFITGASYRKGQEVAISGNPNSKVSTGTWKVSDPGFIQFAIDISKADTLLASDYIAFHWTMTCGNDVIEGQVPNSVPEPSSMLLLGLGLIGIAGLGRSKFRAK